MSDLLRVRIGESAELAVVLCRAMQNEVARLGIADVTVAPPEDAVYRLSRYPASGQDSLLGEWRDAQVVEAVAYDTPIPGNNGQDDLTNLIVSRYNLPLDGEMLYGCTEETARALVAAGRYDELLKLILSKYKVVEQHSDLVLCAGTDFTGVTSQLEFGFNADTDNYENLVAAADGVIVGSALIRAVGAAHAAGQDPAEAARAFVASLRAGIDMA